MGKRNYILFGQSVPTYYFYQILYLDSHYRQMYTINHRQMYITFDNDWGQKHEKTSGC